MVKLTKPFYGNIEKLSLENKNYRKVLSTTEKMQLVLMSLLPEEEIGFEIHPNTSQFIRVEAGEGVAIIDDEVFSLMDGDVVVIPQGAEHNIINTSDCKRLQMYVIYAPPHHPPKTLEKTRPKDEN